jgi:hypothetical protein
MHPTGQWKTHDASVVNDDHDDGESAKKIQTRLARAIGKTRIDSGPHFGFAHKNRSRETITATPQ